MREMIVAIIILVAICIFFIYAAMLESNDGKTCDNCMYSIGADFCTTFCKQQKKEVFILMGCPNKRKCTVKSSKNQQHRKRG